MCTEQFLTKTLLYYIVLFYELVLNEYKHKQAKQKERSDH